MSFDDAVAKVLQAEGGYVNDPRDPGGETKYGISKRAYPNVDIANLTAAQAKEIYRADYWDKPLIGALPDRIACTVFDAAVNSGVAQAVKWLQQAVGVSVDGVIGPATLQAAALAKDQTAVLMRFHGARLAFLTALSTWPAFGKGWARRVANNLMEG